ICDLSFHMHGETLPTQRIRLYQEAINSMMNLWQNKLNSTIDASKLNWILCNLATHIHQYSASSLIKEYDLKRSCIHALITYDSQCKTLQTKALENEANEFIHMIREDVGILAARGKFVYGFLHLTFQEYFTCLHMINLQRSKLKIKNDPMKVADLF
ncbi:unnamed protein product, partial [Didymodactylos carnosus]